MASDALIVGTSDIGRLVLEKIKGSPHLGYEVIQANDIKDAIRICKEHPAPIHLLLTDVIMPEMNGRELAQRLLALHPALKRLFMSGYARDIAGMHGLLDAGAPFIQKPFSVGDIVAHVQRMLESR